jgi:predicted TPR repeat methyltransferase
MKDRVVTDLLKMAREHQRAGRLEDAEALYRKARQSAPADAEAALCLGMVLNELGRVAECIEVLSLLVVDHPKLAAGWVQLARAIAPEGFAWEAHDAIHRALERQPDADTLVTASAVLMTLGNQAAAEKACRRAVKIMPQNVSAWIQLGQLLADDDRKSQAADAYRQALAIEPQNAMAAFFHAALTTQDSQTTVAPPTGPPPDYVRLLFDGYAHRFDGSLVGSLRYRAPKVLDQLFSNWLKRGGFNAARPLIMMDAGCGTGLCGRWMARHRGRLIGVDLSRKMIGLSQTLSIYDELVAGDVVEELQRRPGALDLIVAGDLLVYFGDLTRLFAAAAAALRERGVFLFTVEVATGAGYVLLPTQRFAHSSDYLNRLAASNGLAIRVIDEARLRLEKGSGVPGYFVLAEKSGNALSPPAGVATSVAT